MITPAWTVNATSKIIYGLVPPLLNGTHVHGRWEEEQRRLDLLITGTFPQPNAHGIVGQSYQDAAVRHGKLDEYAVESATLVEDGRVDLPPMTTSAQAEGAIDGVYTDYKLANVFSTAFKYSRYDRVAPAASALAGTATRTASASERYTEDASTKKKEL